MNPKYDLDQAESFCGKRVLVDILVRDHDERLVEQRQLFGEIRRINEDEGVVLRLIPSGEDYRLAPDLDQFIPMAPGRYRLEPDGETIRDPDYRYSSIVHLPPPEFERSDPT
jgi:hypothetical protein